MGKISIQNALEHARQNRAGLNLDGFKELLRYPSV